MGQLTTKFAENFKLLKEEQEDYLEQLNELLAIEDLKPELRLKALKDRHDARIDACKIWNTGDKK